MSDVGVLISLDDTSVEQSKVVLDYTSRDFTAIRSQLVGLAKGMMPEWQTVGEAADFGTLLLELFAYMGDILNYYIDRTASEAFLGTAIRRQSILYIADMLGYTPIGQQAASVELSWTVDPEEEEAEIVIPKGSRVHNDADDADNLIVFELDTDVTLHPGDIDVTSFATEGIVARDVPMGASQGTPNTQFTIPDKGVINNTVKVVTLEGFQVVNWTYTSDLGLARPTQAMFTTYIDEEELTHVVFGDNASGRIPPVNAEMYVTYRFGKGAVANDLSPDAIKVVADVTGLDLSLVKVTNKESPVGGTDPESVDSMRFSIPRAASRLKSRAVTLGDFADLALQVPGIGKSVAYGTIYTAVHVRIAPVGGQANPVYMSDLCTSVEAYMRDKTLVGSQVYAEPTNPDELWLNVWIRIQIHVLAAFNRASVRSQVDSVVRKVLDFNTVDFGYRVSIGAVYRAVLAVQGVEWADLQWLSTEPPPSELIFFPSMPQPALQAAGTATTLLLRGTWGFDTAVSMADPGTGDFRRGTNQFTVSTTDADNNDVHTELAGLKVGDHFVVYEIANPQRWSSHIITTPITNNTTWMLIPGLLLDQAVDPDTGQPTPPESSATTEVLVRLEFIRYEPTPLTPTTDVVNIETPELLIPRIEPTQVTEVFEIEGMPEGEMVHDGLWVYAVGGLPNT